MRSRRLPVGLQLGVQLGLPLQRPGAASDGCYGYSALLAAAHT